ncbi:MAG: EAL domain-containing response regulator [Hyphomonadaceae bacterium]|nr:EAL domain-containing response regulator [Hyphomonadaceae bacterium]
MISVTTPSRIEPDSPSARMPFERALVIDDDPLFQIVISEGLRASGVAIVETANDGVEGLEALANTASDVDLIAVDLQMPNMTGVDVVRELARLGYRGSVIIISSEASNLRRSVENMAKLLGIDILGALGKPLDIDELNDLIHNHRDNGQGENQRLLSRAQVIQAIENRDLIPYFQPKVNLKTRSVTGFEVLARHIENEAGPAPMNYLDAIEKFGLSIDFLCAMIAQAAEQIDGWESPYRSLKLSFNLTPLAVQDSGLPDRLLAAVVRAGLDPKSVTFEITENHLLECTAASLEVLSLMRLYGFDLSIDDFGTGATSIEQLRTFPFTELKIDGRFMMASETDDFSRLTVETSAKLASMLGMTVVAEGVETPSAILFARRSGADEVQGFHFARPMSAEQTHAWLKSYEVDRWSAPA